MSDPLRTDSSRALDGVPTGDHGNSVERDAKIEELLLHGLDHYFAAQYDQAINVWTRALFLDRNHARARAYIERARSALAERQRESEELLQNGLNAFHRGEVEQARRLLQAAVEAGAPFEDALPILERLNRLETTPAAQPAGGAPRGRHLAPARAVDEHRSRKGAAIGAVVVLLLIVVGFGVYAAASWERVDWPSWLVLPRARSASNDRPVAREIVLAPPHRGEMALARARALAAGGHLRDALLALDHIRLTDPQKPDADRLRADIQRQLLDLAAERLP